MKKSDSLESILQTENISFSEFQSILKSGRTKKKKGFIISADSHFKAGYFSDPHIGSSCFCEPLFDAMIKQYKKEKVDMIFCPGDHAEGMSGRPGHIYELEDIGYNAQMKHIINLYSQFHVPVYGIDGNHDGWFFKKNNGGVIVGEDLQRHVKNYTHLGQMEGNLKIDKLDIYFYHGGDGTAYADSYKLQKLIESFTGGQKPNIVLSGHYHKHIKLVRRNVFGFECGTLCAQTEYMKGKKIPAHMGFGIIEVWHDKKGISRLKDEWIPYYS